VSLKGNVKVLWQVENGKKEADVCYEFGIVNSTIQMVWKKRRKIISIFERNGSSVKQFRKPAWSDVSETLFE
jgi:hypothetical protein